MDNITVDSSDIHSIGDLYSLADSKSAFRLTNDDKSLVVMDDEYYRELVTTIKVMKGLDDVKQGNVTSAEIFFKEFKLKHGL
ncbi:MAG: hypothetical protein LBV09_00460 [Deferribacteraceae bacterium]|jgi:hypothetical protein|nr:hypothetical protein [Deferribacteraceae bacterium]